MLSYWWVNIKLQAQAGRMWEKWRTDQRDHRKNEKWRTDQRAHWKNETERKNRVRNHKKNKRAEKNGSKEPQVEKEKTDQRDSENGDNIKRKRKEASKCKWGLTWSPPWQIGCHPPEFVLLWWDAGLCDWPPSTSRQSGDHCPVGVRQSRNIHISAMPSEQDLCVNRHSRDWHPSTSHLSSERCPVGIGQWWNTHTSSEPSEQELWVNMDMAVTDTQALHTELVAKICPYWIDTKIHTHFSDQNMD